MSRRACRVSFIPSVGEQPLPAWPGMLALGRIIGPKGAAGVGFLLGNMAGSLPVLRNRLIDNFKAAGLKPTREQVDRYFRRLGCWAG